MCYIIFKKNSWYVMIRDVIYIIFYMKFYYFGGGSCWSRRIFKLDFVVVVLESSLKYICIIVRKLGFNWLYCGFYGKFN